MSALEHRGNPGPREEVGTENRKHPPHVTEGVADQQVQESAPAPGNVPVRPPNAAGRDKIPGDQLPEQEIRPESMYNDRPGESKERRETDMP